MADGLKVELITRDFNRMLQELAAIDPRVEFADVVKSETVSAIGGAMNRTRAASVGSIRSRWEGKKVATFGGKVYFLENHFPDYVWGEITRLRNESLQTKLGARGLAKQTWVNAAFKLGRSIAAPGYVTAANYKGQQYGENVSVVEAGSGSTFTIEITNRSPLGEGARMEPALLSAMGGRARYFQANMEHHAFRTLATRAAKYPGIFTSAVPPAAG